MDTIKRDPLYYLPYEVWVKCIKLYTHEQPASGALPLIAVSLNWRSRLLEAQELWNTIYLDGGLDELDRAECFFHLSRDLPVELVLDDKSNAEDVIIKYRHRIASLIFYTRSLHFWHHSRRIVRQAERLGGHQYPNLKHIYVEPPCDWEASIPHSLINACPALIGIHGAYIAQETVSMLPASTTSVGIFTSGAFPKGLGDRLEILRVCQVLSHTQEVGHSRYFTNPSIRLTSFQLHYQFKSISSSGTAPQFSDFSEYLPALKGFTSTMHYGLKVLSITMPWYEISRLAPVLSTSTALRELELIVDPATDQPQPCDIPPLTISDIGHVRKLSVTINSGGGRRARPIAPNLRRFLNLFIDGKALGHLEELHLKFFLDHRDPETANSEVLRLLKVTPNLKELHLIGPRLAGMEPTKILLSSLHTLVGRLLITRYLETPNLTCLIDNDPLDRFHDPQTLPSAEMESTTVASTETLENVTASALVFLHWNNAVSKAKSTSNTFPQLKTLELFSLNASHTPLVTPNFSNLQSITFDDPLELGLSIVRIRGRHLDYFILEILLSPAICPRLHTIRATTYPIWALANAMLRRRNSLRTVTPIRSFWLPGYPQIAISRLISQALDTPTEDRGVSMDTASRADTTIRLRWELDFFRLQACPFCIASGYVACPPEHKAPMREEPPSDPAIRDLLDLDTVATSASRYHWEAYLDAVKDSWSVSHSMFEAPKFKRPCGRHDRKDLVCLGPHTLDGTTYDLF